MKVTPPAAALPSAVSVAPPTFAAQLDAYRSSVVPPMHASPGARMVIIAAVAFVLGIAVLCALFLSA